MDPLTQRSSRVVASAKLHRSSYRRAHGEFLVEGSNSVQAAIHSAVARTVFVRDTDQHTFAELLESAVSASIAVAVITARAADKLAETATTPGIFAVCSTLARSLDDVLGDNGQSATTLAVGVDISDPGNVGTLIRTADATGCAAVVLLGDSVDPHNGKCVRSSAGSMFTVPVAVHRNIAEGLAAISASGRRIYATTAGGELSLEDLDSIAGDSPLRAPSAWLFGNEAHGLSDETLAAADNRVSIPIRGQAESLNIAVAAAMCLYVDSRVVHAS